MRVLVTGAQGFLGREILRVLRQFGDEVIATGRRAADSVYCCDLSDRTAVQTMLASVRPDRIIHCAAYVPRAQADYSSEMHANSSLLMLHNVLHSASCPVLFISSMTVYGEVCNRAMREDDAGNPTSAYGLGKWRAEQLLHTYPHPTLSIRIPGLFGPERRTGLIYNVIYALKYGEQLPQLPRSPLLWAAMHVRDAAWGAAKLAHADFSGHQAINLGYPGEFAVDLFLQIAANQFGRVIPYSLTHPRFTFNLTRAQSFDAYSDKTLQEALLEFAEEI